LRSAGKKERGLLHSRKCFGSHSETVFPS
jgi:hypothetical protein